MRNVMTNWYFSSAEGTLSGDMSVEQWQEFRTASADNGLTALDLKLSFPACAKVSGADQAMLAVQSFLRALLPGEQENFAPFSGAPFGALWTLDTTAPKQASVRIRVLHCAFHLREEATVEQRVGWAYRAWLMVNDVRSGASSGLVLLVNDLGS